MAKRSVRNVWTIAGSLWGEDMDKDKYFETSCINGRIQQAIAESTAKALILCCEQEPEFEEAVEQSDKSFQDCLDHVAKGVGESISDLDAYNKAVKFYFSTASVHFNMRINLSGDNGYTPPPITMNTNSSKSGELSVSLDELLDF